jgi:hypothetical protein
VEAEMLIKVQKRNKAFKDLQQWLIQQICQEYQKTSGGSGWQQINTLGMTSLLRRQSHGWR